MSFDDMDRRVFSIQKITYVTGFKPRYRLHDTIETMIRAARQRDLRADIA
jgi:nucleoside-diphosphate-sugar epimerase